MVENVTFVAPTMLESIDLVETSGSASLRFFNVTVGHRLDILMLDL